MYRKAHLTQAEQKAMEIMRVAFMNKCPFLSYYFYECCIEYPTRDVEGAQTDGRRIYYNPDFMMGLKPAERLFVLAHEVAHIIYRHPLRMKHYGRTGYVRDLIYNSVLMNIAMDYVINADLVENGIGSIRPEWLYNKDYKSGDLPEDIYEKLYKKLPEQPNGGCGTGGGVGAGGNGEKNPPSQPGGGDGGKSDGTLSHQQPQDMVGGGDKASTSLDKAIEELAKSGFDEVRAPEIDPVSGAEDTPGEGEFKEAVARAAAAPKRKARCRVRSSAWSTSSWSRKCPGASTYACWSPGASGPGARPGSASIAGASHWREATWRG